MTRGLRERKASPGRRLRTSVPAGAALVLCAAFAAVALAASVNFTQLSSSPEAAADTPVAIVAADLDGDADQDLAVANHLDDNVTILRNTGSGNFTEPRSSPEAAGSGPRSLVAADLDGDTDQDLAVANGFSGNVTVLRNNGSGNFTEPATSPEPVLGGPFSVVAANLDGDGDQDLAVANSNSDNVTVLRNNGAANFTQPASSPETVGDGPVSLVAADLTGDGNRDLAVANGNADNVTVLRNNGAANFTPAASSPEAAGDRPRWVVAADLDGDADEDLAVVNEFSEDLTVLRNAGTGNFTEPPSSPEMVGGIPMGAAAADFDLDTDRDLAVAKVNADSVAILRNLGNGNFTQPTSSPEAAGDGPISVAAADLDGDGDRDLAIANVLSDNVTVLRNP